MKWSHNTTLLMEAGVGAISAVGGAVGRNNHSEGRFLTSEFYDSDVLFLIAIAILFLVWKDKVDTSASGLPPAQVC